MPLFRSLALSALGACTASALSLTDVSHGNTPADKACQYLHTNFPNVTSFSNQTAYVNDNTLFWSAASSLSPACIFAPACAEDLGTAVQSLKYFNSSFAMRGGGHMPIGDYNNINSSGVLLSSSGFKRLALSADKKSLHVGPGNHWGDVYKFLEPYGLTIVGGRLGVVGIPGFITGGGISFLSWEHGWSSANIKSMTVVLASGEVVTASPHNEFSDLFWALRGGGNSFGLVTEFEMLTYPSPVITVGQSTYGVGSAIKDKWLEAAYNFAIYGADQDAKSTVTPIANGGTIHPDGITYTAMKFYNGNDTNAPALANFTGPNLPPINDTFAPRTFNQWNELMAPQFTQTVGLRERFYVMTTYADKKAMSIVHDTWAANMNSSLAGLEFYITGLTPMPISKQFFRASRVNGGDPMDLDPSDGPQIWYELSVTYGSASDEAAVTAFVNKVGTEVQQKLTAAGIKWPKYLYLNDADKGQPVFEGYPAKSVRRLKKIRAKYDPDMTFTKQMPGGWKVENCQN